MTPEEKIEIKRLNDFLRPGIEAQFKRDCCVKRPYKLPRNRPDRLASEGG